VHVETICYTQLKDAVLTNCLTNCIPFLSNKKLSANRRSQTKHYTQHHIQYRWQIRTSPQHINSIKRKRGECRESAADTNSQKQQKAGIELRILKRICGNQSNQKCPNDIDSYCWNRDQHNCGSGFPWETSFPFFIGISFCAYESNPEYLSVPCCHPPHQGQEKQRLHRPLQCVSH